MFVARGKGEKGGRGEKKEGEKGVKWEETRPDT